jgi:hypothetical protein
MKKETKLQELERRIAELEKNRITIIQQPLQPYIQPMSYQTSNYMCPVCHKWVSPGHICGGVYCATC